MLLCKQVSQATIEYNCYPPEASNWGKTKGVGSLVLQGGNAYIKNALWCLLQNLVVQTSARLQIAGVIVYVATGVPCGRSPTAIQLSSYMTNEGLTFTTENHQTLPCLVRPPLCIKRRIETKSLAHYFVKISGYFTNSSLFLKRTKDGRQKRPCS